MNKEDRALIREFMQVTQMPDGWALEVAVVDWPNPSEPRTTWKRFEHWPVQPSKRVLTATRKRALESKRFFRICQHCGERNNIGHMHDDKICQSCAVNDFGVVY